MSSGNHEAAVPAEQLSALLDGELDDTHVGSACAAWRDQPAARATWHAYHLIGDVMRSDDLSGDAGRDAAFLKSLRSRLAQEPVVLAPAAVTVPVVAAGRRSLRGSWRAPAAVAAGFVVVAGVLVVTRTPSPVMVETVARQSQPVVARMPAVATAVEAVSEPETLVANGKLIRDARLDRYLAAHKQFAGTSALGVPSAFLRSATADAANR